ncbi:MAG: hypothetical protein JSW11_15730 [Candidatus Heimdallarchaeota archaeon]|nr:MAG: hypothetical protein JSW11_15730 [Candidatus Heimdallarchaeota archaeon]
MVFTVTKDHIDQMTIGKSIFLHLFPILLILMFDILAAPIVEALGFPLLLTLILADLLILIPIELAILLYMSKKETNNFNIKGLIPYFKPLPPKTFLVQIQYKED